MEKLYELNLTQKKFWVEELPSSFIEHGLGGKALGLNLLLRERVDGDDPLSPLNKIILSAGLLTATGAPTGAWLSLLTRSPLTGLLTVSSIGGDFPVRLKQAGYDAIIIEGKAQEPTSLVIGEGIHFLPATSIWGKTVGETDEFFATRWDRKMRVLCIGPAGERQYKTATPVMDRSRNGISPGLGAVMGSKNLKAIAAYGEKHFAPADPEQFRVVSSKILERISRKFKTFRELSNYGTGNFLHLFNEHNVLPTRNFAAGRFPELEKDEEEIFTKNSLPSRKIACFSCPIGCRKLTQMPGPAGQNFYEGPDFLELVSFGSLCGNHDRRSIMEARHRCNELGVDILSVGAGISSAMSLFEQGLIPESEVGLPLHFGNSQAMLELLNHVEKDEGLGKLLAADPIQVAQDHRSPESLFQIRNQPVGPSHPLYDSDMDLHYRLSNSGTWPILGAKPFREQLEVYEQFGAKNEVSRVRLLQDIMGALESLGLCEYLLLFLNVNDISSLIPPILGIELDPKTLLELGENLFNAERQINIEWDRFQNLLCADPSWSNERKDEKIAEYFSLRNWDNQGKPKSKIGLW